MLRPDMRPRECGKRAGPQKTQSVFWGAPACLPPTDRDTFDGGLKPAPYIAQVTELRRGDACVALDPQHRMRKEGRVGVPKKRKAFFGVPRHASPLQPHAFR